jgi:hypothetical protein
MNYYSKIFIISILGLILLHPINLFAQEIKKDVTVLKPYQPVVNDAVKINEMPVFNDTSTVSADYQYSIRPVKVFSKFKPRVVPAASIAQETVPELRNNYVKLGIGNPFAPLADISVNNGRSKENSYGAFLHHQSADGKVKLNNAKETEVDAPYSDNSIELYGKHLFKHSELKANIDYGMNKIVFYGYEPSLQPSLNLDSNTQKYQHAGAAFSIKSLQTDSNKLWYSAQTNFGYLSDNYNHAENNIYFASQFKKRVKGFYTGADISYNYFLSGGSNDTSYNGIFIIKPYLSKGNKDWRLIAGLNVVFDNNKNGTTLLPYPFIKFDFTIAPRVLKAFVGYDGQLEINSFSNIVKINPYLNPSVIARNTNCKTRITAGLVGNMSSNSQFIATASYSDIKDLLLFINDTITPLHNTFLPVYASAELIKFKAEAMFHISEKLDFSLSGSFSNFSMLKKIQPWNIPIFEANTNIKYNIQNKIISTTDIFLIGQRYARNPLNGESITLSTFADFNETIEYRYTKLFSIFVQFKNFTAAKYQYWNQYPSFRFQVMGGITYLF